MKARKPRPFKCNGAKFVANEHVLSRTEANKLIDWLRRYDEWLQFQQHRLIKEAEKFTAYYT